MNSAQEHFQALLDDLVRRKVERGLQLAVYHEGRLIVNAAAGVADPHSGRPVGTDTLFPVFSVSKGFTATVIHHLVERGQLAYDQPVCEVWPEFGAHGKEAISLRHLLSHTAGMQYVPAGMGFVDLCDWPTMCAALAAQRPAWKPGSCGEYHAMTYGWLLGEVAQRASGKSFAELLEEIVKRPLGVRDLYMGLPEAEEPRVATVEEAPAKPAVPGDPFKQMVPRWAMPLADSANRKDFHRACLPGFGAITNAESIARHYAALLPGGLNGVELLPSERVMAAIQPQGTKDAQGEPCRWLLGYRSSDDVLDPVNPPQAFGHDGHGGACGMADRDRKLAVGFALNLFLRPETRGEILAELRKMF